MNFQMNFPTNFVPKCSARNCFNIFPFFPCKVANRNVFLFSEKSSLTPSPYPSLYSNSIFSYSPSKAFNSYLGIKKSERENAAISSFLQKTVWKDFVDRASFCQILNKPKDKIPLVSCKSSKPLGPAYTDRPSLDDVHRLSRGQPSKSKIGSRKVPHRLSAEERKAFDLAKKRGYVVLKVRSRIYPLVNTYRNLCDAIGYPNVRIEQEESGLEDALIVDLSTLRIDGPPLETLSREISLLSQTLLINPQPKSFEEPFGVRDESSDSDVEVNESDKNSLESKVTDGSIEGERVELQRERDKLEEEGDELDGGLEELGIMSDSKKILFFKGNRQYAKELAKRVVKVCEENVKGFKLTV